MWRESAANHIRRKAFREVDELNSMEDSFRKIRYTYRKNNFKKRQNKFSLLTEQLSTATS